MIVNRVINNISIAVETTAQPLIAGDDDVADLIDLPFPFQEVLGDVLLGVVENLRDHVLNKMEIRIRLFVLCLRLVEFCRRQQTHGVRDAFHACDTLDPPFYGLGICL